MERSVRPALGKAEDSASPRGCRKRLAPGARTAIMARSSSSSTRRPKIRMQSLRTALTLFSHSTPESEHARRRPGTVVTNPLSGKGGKPPPSLSRLTEESRYGIRDACAENPGFRCAPSGLRAALTTSLHSAMRCRLAVSAANPSIALRSPPAYISMTLRRLAVSGANPSIERCKLRRCGPQRSAAHPEPPQAPYIHILL
jgi:hypothetical protein